MSQVVARALHFSDLAGLSAFMKKLKVDAGGIPIMALKGVWRFILLEQLTPHAANILKQEALARHCELAVPYSVADLSPEPVDALLFGPVAGLRSLVAKLYRQTIFGLPELGDEIQRVLMATVPGYFPVARGPQREVPRETLDDYLGGRLLRQPGARAPQLPPLALADWPPVAGPVPIVPSPIDGYHWLHSRLVEQPGPEGSILCASPGQELGAYQGVVALRLTQEGDWFSAGRAALQAGSLPAEHYLFQVPPAALPALEALKSLGRPVMVDLSDAEAPAVAAALAALRGADLIWLPEAPLVASLHQALAARPAAPEHVEGIYSGQR